MKYIEDEHEMKVKEQRMKMEILNMKKENVTTSCVIHDKQINYAIKFFFFIAVLYRT